MLFASLVTGSTELPLSSAMPLPCEVANLINPHGRRWWDDDSPGQVLHIFLKISQFDAKTVHLGLSAIHRHRLDEQHKTLGCHETSTTWSSRRGMIWDFSTTPMRFLECANLMILPTNSYIRSAGDKCGKPSGSSGDRSGTGPGMTRPLESRNWICLARLHVPHRGAKNTPATKGDSNHFIRIL